MLEITEAFEHNLKHISLRLPKNRLIVVTGPSGSGKSSLVQDTLFRESQRLFFESLALYSKSYIRLQEPAKVKKISHLSPSIAIDQKTRVMSRRSTVGTVSEVMDYLRLLYARFGYLSETEEGTLPLNALPDFLSRQSKSKKVWIAVPIIENKKGSFRNTFQKLLKFGYVYVLADGEQTLLTPDLALSRHQRHTITVLVDRLKTDQLFGKEKLKQLTEHLNKLEAQTCTCIIEDKHYVFTLGGGIPHFEPHHFSFNSPFGKCETCDGLGEDGGGHLCPVCQGSRIKQKYSSVKYHDVPFQVVSLGTLSDVLDMFHHAQGKNEVEQAMLQHFLEKVKVLNELGLGYLSLSRSADTLSGGETQRLRIGSQINHSTSGMLYLFDEPSIGLHPINTDKLLTQLKSLSNQNTVIVVEHDLDTLRASDYLVELGPGGGIHGGEVIYSGETQRFLKNKRVKASKTHPFLSTQANVDRVVMPLTTQGKKLECFKDIHFRNLHIPKLELPLGQLVTIAGVSGSGKSSLLFDVLLPELKNRDHKVYWVTQDPIGKSSRSAVVTFLEIYTFIRSVFAASPSARIRGLKARDFSFNSSPHRCEKCGGKGLERFELSFLPQAEVVCQLCQGRRFNPFVLRVRYNDRSIADVLDMTLEEAAKFFQAYPKLKIPLRLCLELGLGYLKLGQVTSTLSGGEAQRLKLIYELSKRKAKGHIYCLDEPTTGLSSYDIQFLLKLFASIIAEDNSVLTIEHQTDVIAQSQHVIELGPGGGPRGGHLIAQGSPEQIRSNKSSVIAKFLPHLG